MNVMPDLFRHPNLSAQIPRSRNAVRDDKVFLRWFYLNDFITPVDDDVKEGLHTPIPVTVLFVG